MCGFAGYFPSLSKETDNLYLNKMLESTRYRGPDQTNIYRNDQIALGHHRLSIIDLNGGKQPVVDKKSGDCLVYNGEIYNFRSLTKFLIQNNVSLEEKSDTEVLFKLLANFGVKNTLERIDGMFSFVFYSKKENNIYLARDRAGEKPLYYSIYKKLLIFGSELKTVSSFPGLSKCLNFSAINEYLNLDYIPLEKTLVSEIKKVLPGHYLQYSPDNKKIIKYWELNLKNKNNTHYHNNLDELDNLLENSVENRLVADVPVGLFLSGGIDSSLLAYYCKKQSANIKTFTIQMSNKSYDEYGHAIKVAKHLKLKNYSLRIDEKKLSDALIKIENCIDEPVNDPSLLPTYLVSKLAKEHVKVAISGDGADELFSGYSPFKHLKIIILLSFLPKRLGSLMYWMLSRVPAKDNYMSLSFLLKNISKGIGFKPEEQIFRWMASFCEPDIKNLFSADFNEQYFKNNNLFEDSLAYYKKNNANLHDSISSLFFNHYLCNDLLTKVDRSSMLNSLEVRSPFLDKNIIDFSSSLKNSYKVKNQTKLILRKLSEKKLPSAIIQRKKHGFAIPLANMLRTSLKEKVTDTLTSDNTKIHNFVNKKALNKILDKHNNGIDNRKIIWSLYILEKSIVNVMNNNKISS